MTAQDVHWTTQLAVAQRKFTEPMLDHLIEMIAQPSVSATSEGVSEMSAQLADILEFYGFESQTYRTDGHPVVVGRVEAAASAPTVLFYGHYDVQPPGDDGWDSDPYRAVIRDGHIYGRGSADSKGQLLAVIVGIAVAREIAPDLPINVIILADGEEEVGSPHLRDLVRRHRDEFRADVGYLADGSVHPSGTPLIALGTRGLLCVELTVEDDRGALHSGNFGGVVESPVWRLATALGSLLSARPAWAGAPAPSEAALALVSLLPPVEAPSGARPESAAEDHWRLVCTEPSLNISGITGGYVGPGFQTAIPEKATARLDARLVPGQRPDAVFDAIRACLDELPFDVQLRQLAATPPVQVDADHSWPKFIEDQLRDVYGAAPYVLPVLPGTVPLAAFVEELEIPMVVVPHGNADQNNHAPNENLNLQALDRAVETVARLLLTPWGR